MKLRTQFIITIFLFGIILVVMAVSAITANQQIEKSSKQEKIANDIAQGASELSYLANEYLIYRESQQLKRSQSRFASFSSQVGSLNVVQLEQQALVRNIQANTRRLKEVFDSVVSVPAGAPPDRSTAPGLEFLQVSWSRMAVQSQGLVSDASRLSQLLHQQMDQLTNRRTMFIYLMVGLFGAFLLASYMLTYRRILKSLATLQARAAVIGSGNLDFIIEEKKNDEIGDLSRAFNRMTANLKDVTASKSELERQVAEREQAEQALRESEAQLRAILENLAEGVAVSDLDGRFLYWNRACLDMHGFSSPEESQRRLPDFGGIFELSSVDDTVLPVDKWPLSRILRGEHLRDLEIRIRRHNTDWQRVFSYGGTLARDTDGKPVLAVVTVADITERKRAEEAVRDSEARLNRAQEIAHLGSWELDLVNNRLNWSDEVYRIFGLQPQEFGATYEAFLEAVHPDDRTAVDAAYLDSVREGRDTYEIEHRVVRKSTGEIRIVHERCEHIRDASRRIILSLGMVHDLTERKLAEEALKQRTLELQKLTETLEQRVQERTEALEEANKALRNLSTKLLSAQEEERKRIAGELHDTIGACLSGIKFKVESSLQQIGKTQTRMTESLKTIVPLIQEGVEECRRIQMDLRPSMLDDLGLLPTLSWFCRRFQTIYSGIRIEQEMGIEEGDMPPPLKTVAFRVTQEAMNNSAKHSQANIVRLSLRKINDRIELLIEDNGRGFDLEKAFDSENERRGLGLTSMRERIELSGGSFAIDSAKGKGTIVRAWWPI